MFSGDNILLTCILSAGCARCFVAQYSVQRLCVVAEPVGAVAKKTMVHTLVPHLGPGLTLGTDVRVWFGFALVAQLLTVSAFCALASHCAL